MKLVRKMIFTIVLIVGIVFAIDYLGVFKPETVVLKMANGLKNGDYETVVSCLDPDTERDLNIIGGITAGVVKSQTSVDLSWGQLMYLGPGKSEIEVIECYSDNKVIKSGIGAQGEWIYSLPLVSDVLGTEADVHIKFNTVLDGKSKTGVEVYRVKKYGLSGWRVDGNQVIETQWLN